MNELNTLTVLGIVVGVVAPCVVAAYVTGQRNGGSDAVIAALSKELASLRAEFEARLNGIRDTIAERDDRVAAYWRDKWPVVERLALKLDHLETRFDRAESTDLVRLREEITQLRLRMDMLDKGANDG